MSQQMQDAVKAYIQLFNDQDAQGIADLYADDATVTNPVGTPPLKKAKKLYLRSIQWP